MALPTRPDHRELIAEAALWLRHNRPPAYVIPSLARGYPELSPLQLLRVVKLARQATGPEAQP
jgi:hypothetical protein